MDFMAMAQECAPDAHPTTLAAVVATESSFNPYAIGVVGGQLERQPRHLDEAVATAKALMRDGWNASFGLGQVNKANLAKFGLDLTTVFDPCQNLKAAAAILGDNYRRATRVTKDEQQALQLALSEYYSGNYTTGFKHGYVQKVIDNAAKAIPVVATASAPAAVAAAASSVPATPALAAKPASRAITATSRGTAAERSADRKGFLIVNDDGAPEEQGDEGKATVMVFMPLAKRHKE